MPKCKKIKMPNFEKIQKVNLPFHQKQKIIHLNYPSPSLPKDTSQCKILNCMSIHPSIYDAVEPDLASPSSLRQPRCFICQASKRQSKRWFEIERSSKRKRGREGFVSSFNTKVALQGLGLWRRIQCLPLRNSLM